MTRDRKFLLGECAFITGISIYPFLDIHLWILFAFAALCMAFVFYSGDSRAGITALALLFLISGIIRFSMYTAGQPSDEELAYLDGKKVELDCRVAEMPEADGDKRKIVLDVAEGQEVRGRILAYSSIYEDYDYGDRLKFYGKLKLPQEFDGFDYPAYLRGKGIYLISYYPQMDKTGDGGGISGIIYEFRKEADKDIKNVMPSPQSGIVSAMTLGTRPAETREVMDKFNATGTSHVIAVSGYHLVIVVAVLMYLLLGFGIRRGDAFYITLLGIFVYIVLSGSSASAVRSGIMASVFLLATKVGRGKHIMNALIFSAFLMIMQNPYILTRDIGFQLSFLATFGLVTFLPFLERRCEGLPRLGGLKEMLLVTIAAQIAVLPVLVLNFGRFSLLSLLANVLILPSVPLLMGLGFLVVTVSPFSLLLARILSFPAYLIVSYEIAVVDCLADVDWGVLQF